MRHDAYNLDTYVVCYCDTVVHIQGWRRVSESFSCGCLVAWLGAGVTGASQGSAGAQEGAPVGFGGLVGGRSGCY